MAYLSNSIFTSLVVAVILVVYTAEAFMPSQRRILVPRISSSIVVSSNTLLKSSEGGDDEVGLPPLPSQKGAVVKKKEPVTAAVEEPAAPAAEREVSTTSNVVVDEEEGTSYPIDLPSPVLLGASMVLAISSIGSLFELTGGAETQLGFVGTAALAAIGAPFSLFLLYAAIMKGAAETEEDDREYNSPRKF